MTTPVYGFSIVINLLKLKLIVRCIANYNEQFYKYEKMFFKYLYYYMRNFCNLIGLEQLYFSLIWNTYMWKLQTFCG